MFNDSRKPPKFQEPPPIFSKIPRFSSFFFVGVVFFLSFDDIFVKKLSVRLNIVAKLGKIRRTGGLREGFASPVKRRVNWRRAKESTTEAKNEISNDDARQRA